MNSGAIVSFCVLSLLVLSSEGRFLEDFKRNYDPFHRECGIESADRKPCGRKADRIDEAECRARSCCWEEKPEEGSPGCFLPKRMLKPECDVAYEEKDDCGYYGISEGECNMRGCCYKPGSLPNDPSCYHKRRDALRLVGGSSEREGRVEVEHDGTWGTVCDDGFGKEEARVICKSLGYESGNAYIEARFGQGSDAIWLDSLRCTGNEESLEQCAHDGWGNHDCSHAEDAGVRCLNAGEEDDEDNSDGDGSGGSYYWSYRSYNKPSE